MIKPLAVLASISLAACSYAGSLDAWDGQSIDDLIYAWGPPASDTVLEDQRRVVSFHHERDADGNTLYCDAIFRTDVNSVIIDSNTNGNLGGCNRLIGSMPSP